MNWGIELMTKSDKIRLFRETFRGRQDTVPIYWTSRKTGRSGYSPLCRNEWQRPGCQKGIIKGSCNACKKTDYTPLSDSLIQGHFAGKHILGVYPLLADNTCHFIGADFDNHTADKSPLDDVAAFYEICEAQEIPCYILRSKSGNGYHAFIFFEEPVPAWKARSVAFALLQEAEVVGDETELSSFDRLFPNQDSLSGKGFGNLIALPFQGKASKAGHTLFLAPESGFTASCANQWKILAEVEEIAESVLDDLIEEWQLYRESSEVFKIWKVSKNWKFSDYPKSDFARIAERCAFIAHCRDDAKTLPEPDWYILLTIAARCENGEYLSHKLSEAYPEYTPQETDAKIYHALNSTGPYCCRTIKRISGKYCRACRYYGGVRSPIVLGRPNHTYLRPGQLGQTAAMSGPPCALTKEENELIRRYYAFYRSLDQGTRKPNTSEQKHFQGVCRGRWDARNIHERAYLKYRARE